MKFADEIKGKRVLVFGLGLQGGGLGDALWLYHHGADVRITDAKHESELHDSLRMVPQEITRTLGGHSAADIDWADYIIKNPGVPDDIPLLSRARDMGKPVMTSIAVFVREAKSKVIGITGTRGKSTTTELIYQLLSSLYPGKIIRGGNIPGTSGLELLDHVEMAEYAVLELSSFQLHNFHELRVSPHIAVVTNLYPDHLNRYPSMNHYAEDKKAIAAYQTKDDFVIENQDNDGSREIASVSGGHHIVMRSIEVPSSWHVLIPGAHNLSNIAMLMGVAHALNISDEQVKSVVENFHGIPFRLENRGVKQGVTFINDTTASTPTAALIAIRAMTQPTCIIVGGQTKKLPTREFIDELVSADTIKKIVILGAQEEKDFVQELKTRCPAKVAGHVFSMQEAVDLARSVSQPGWNILLSPGFTSFDLFDNEFERGRQFNEIVDHV